MIFNKNFDNSLWLMLASDKGNRDKIADIIRIIPEEEYEKICKYVAEYNACIESGRNYYRKYTLKGNFVDSEDVLYSYMFYISGDGTLVLEVCRSINSEKGIEKYLEITLQPITDRCLFNMEYLEDFYFGTFSNGFQKKYDMDGMNLRTNVGVMNEYDVTRTPFGGVVTTMYGGFLPLFGLVNYNNKPDELYREDLTSKESLNKLVRVRKR